MLSSADGNQSCIAIKKRSSLPALQLPWLIVYVILTMVPHHVTTYYMLTSEEVRQKDGGFCQQCMQRPNRLLWPK